MAGTERKVWEAEEEQEKEEEKMEEKEEEEKEGLVRVLHNVNPRTQELKTTRP